MIHPQICSPKRDTWVVKSPKLQKRPLNQSQTKLFQSILNLLTIHPVTHLYFKTLERCLKEELRFATNSLPIILFNPLSFEDTSSEALVIRSKNIRSAEHQKHISPEATSPELTKDSVRSVRPRTLQPPSLQFVSLQQDKDNSNIAAEVVPFVLEWI